MRCARHRRQRLRRTSQRFNGLRLFASVTPNPTEKPLEPPDASDRSVLDELEAIVPVEVTPFVAATRLAGPDVHHTH